MISSQTPIHVVTQTPQKRTKRKGSKHAVNLVYYIFLRTSFYYNFLSIQVHIFIHVVAFVSF